MIDFKVTVLDFETTGSVRGYPVEPWQIGLLDWQGRVIDGSAWESLIRVGDRPFNNSAPGRHQVMRPEIAAAPSPSDLWPILRSRLSGPLAAHNIGTERSVLRRIAPLHRFGPWIDTLQLARMAWPSAPSHALDDLIGMLCLTEAVEKLCPMRAPHDALYDACACAVLLSRLLKEPGWEKLSLQALTCAAKK